MQPEPDSDPSLSPPPTEAAPLERVSCPHCGRDVERTDFCGACGRSLDTESAAAPPAGSWRRPRWRRLLPALGAPLQPRQVAALWRVAAIGAVLVLLALLADAPGVAVVLAAAVVPTVVVMVLRTLDVFEHEPAAPFVTVAVAGAVAGLMVALANDVLVDELWLDGAVLNVGAAGFAGPVAAAAGSPPLGLLLLSGLAIPLLGEGFKLLGPMLMRRRPAFRNEVMDGATLGAAAGAGYAAATVTVHFWPLIANGRGPGGDVSDWTASLIGLVAVRPLIVTLSGALLGAGIWHAGLTRRPRDAAATAGPALVAALLLALGSLLLQPSGTLPELAWGLVVLAGLAAAVRRGLRLAVERDRAAVGPGTGRLRCATCGSVTPAGAYCARCGAPLATATPTGAPLTDAPTAT